MITSRVLPPFAGRDLLSSTVLHVPNGAQPLDTRCREGLRKKLDCFPPNPRGTYKMGGRGVVSMQKQLVGANKIEPWAEPSFAGFTCEQTSCAFGAPQGMKMRGGLL